MLSTKLGKTLYGYLNTLYEEILSHKADVIELLRSKDYLFLWKENLMDFVLASDLRSEQLVKLVKTWPEVGSRNILGGNFFDPKNCQKPPSQKSQIVEILSKKNYFRVQS